MDKFTAFAISKYSLKDRTEVIVGVVLTNLRISRPYLERLIREKIFYHFLKELHPKARTAIQQILLNEKTDFILKNFENSEFSLSSEIERVVKNLEQDPYYYLKLLSRLFVQYVSALAVTDEVFSARTERILELINLSQKFPKLAEERFERGFQELSDVLKILKESSPLLYKTKYSTLNHFFGGGLRRKRLYVVSGDTGIGKSHFLLNFFIDAALKDVKVLYLTLENSLEETRLRIVSNLLETDVHELENLDEDEVRSKFESKKDLFEKIKQNSFILERSYLRLDELKQILDQIQPKLLLLDYLNLIDHSVYQSRHKDLEDLTIRLHQEAKERDIAIIAAAQQNRESARANDPDRTGIGESYGIVRSSDVFAVLYHPLLKKEYETESEKYLVFKIDKSRISRKFRFFLSSKKEISKFEELSLSEYQELYEKLASQSKS